MNDPRQEEPHADVPRLEKMDDPGAAPIGEPPPPEYAHPQEPLEDSDG